MKKEKRLPAVVLGDGAVAVSENNANLVEYNRLFEELKQADMSCFLEIARLRNISIEEVIDECCKFELENFMKKLGKVVTRYHISDGELEKVLINCNTLKTGEVILSPVYLDSCRKGVVKNQLVNQFIGAVVDFPFGESAYKSKVADIKSCIKTGVDGITVMVANTLTEKDNRKTLKKQIKSISRLCKSRSGIALSAMELSGENLKFAIRLAEKTKLEHITFVFGTVTKDELSAKMGEIIGLKCKKKIKVMANVENCEEVLELIKYGVDAVLTPYADDIGKDLAKRLKIKNLKLV